ncbi:D-threo-aldose 1-dehydrogenase [Kineococcus xinjiangensis]|uniref:D-threo-aldose 1-dehydrogenase n=1 Tax=Kineococcus xinjiangensis TaxID=512762 RepID=A0A2S6IWN9_9ACTN|nr:aldo/keto reductase [Kineococcus xinjiangensis]PPK98696.1 D-threo-aldose 1-dehydrogenase [Kineococcus xinjiangensis]
MSDGAAQRIPGPPSPWPTRPLGATGLEVSTFGFGAGPLGGLFDEVGEEEAQAALEAAWAAGVRFFDVAPHYGAGLAERRLGAFLAGKPREEFVVATKVGRLLVDDADLDTAAEQEGFRGGLAKRRVRDYSADGVRRSLSDSLERLGLDRVDVVFVHDPHDYEREATTTALPELARLRDEGVVTAIGAGVDDLGMQARFVRTGLVDVLLVPGRWTLLDRSAGAELLPLCLERGVSVVVGGALNSGILADPSPGARFDYAPAPEQVLALARRQQDVCGRHGCSLLQAALQFPLRHPAVVGVLVGLRSPAEARAAAADLASPVPVRCWEELELLALPVRP